MSETTTVIPAAFNASSNSAANFFVFPVWDPKKRRTEVGFQLAVAVSAVAEFTTPPLHVCMPLFSLLQLILLLLQLLLLLMRLTSLRWVEGTSSSR